LSDFLEVEGLNLVGFKDNLTPALVKNMNEGGTPRDTDAVIYEDYSPFMLIGESSLTDLNKRLDKKVTMRSFRPNFVVRGGEAYGEDDWTRFSIGETSFEKIKHCTRCVLTTVDPDKGEKDPNMQPLKTLKEYIYMH
jgi:uncharacterized protein YcbX